MKYDYKQLFLTVKNTLNQWGMEINEDDSPPAGEEDIEGFEESVDLILPKELRAFYLTYADGYRLAWCSPDSGPGAFWGVCEIASLRELLDNKCELAEYIDECVEENKENASIYDPEFLRKSREMFDHSTQWLPFMTGDNEYSEEVRYCVDCITGKVIFFPNEWYDGLTMQPKINITVIAEDFYSFLMLWSKRLFMSDEDFKKLYKIASDLKK